MLLVLAAGMLDVADLGMPLSKGMPLARAADHADPGTRAACAALLPLTCATVPRLVSKMYSAGMALLHRLAADEDEAVRSAVAASLADMAHLQVRREHRHACFGQARTVAHRGPMKAFTSPQQPEFAAEGAQPSSSSSSPPQLGTLLSAQDLISFCDQLLLTEAKTHIQVVFSAQQLHTCPPAATQFDCTWYMSFWGGKPHTAPDCAWPAASLGMSLALKITISANLSCLTSAEVLRCRCPS